MKKLTVQTQNTNIRLNFVSAAAQKHIIGLHVTCVSFCVSTARSHHRILINMQKRAHLSRNRGRKCTVQNKTRPLPIAAARARFSFAVVARPRKQRQLFFAIDCFLNRNCNYRMPLCLQQRYSRLHVC